MYLILHTFLSCEDPSLQQAFIDFKILKQKCHPYISYSA